MDKRTLACLILKGLIDGEKLVTEQDLGIGIDEYYTALDSLQDDGLIGGIKFLRSNKDKRITGIALNCAEITADGMQYLDENWF